MKMKLFTDKEGRNWVKILSDTDPDPEPEVTGDTEPDKPEPEISYEEEPDEPIFPENESEAEWARGEGFWIDEDNNWHPLGDEDDW